MPRDSVTGPVYRHGEGAAPTNVRDDGTEFRARDTRHLTPQQWSALRKRIIARAHDERKQAILQMVGATRRGIQRVRIAIRWAIDALRKAFASRLAARKRLQDLRQLSAMSDDELKDIGISRLEIRAALCSREKRLSRQNDE